MTANTAGQKPRAHGMLASAHSVTAESGSGRYAVPLAVGFSLLAVLRDSLILLAKSYAIRKDSVSYIGLGEIFFDRNGPYIPYRSVPYPLVNALAHSSTYPLVLVWTQILVGAIAAGALVYVVSQRDAVLASAMGIFLVTDVTWAGMHRVLLTESLAVSFSLLSLAILFRHADKTKMPPPWEFVLAGVLYAWAFSVRPSSIYTLVIIPLAYLLLTRSWRKTLLASAGMALLLTLFGFFNLWRTGTFRQYGQTGIYLGWVVLLSDTYSADQGPASSELERQIKNCLPNADLEEIDIADSNDEIWRRFIPCLRDQGNSYDEIASLFESVLIESIRAQPGAYADHVLDGAMTMLYMETEPSFRKGLRCTGVNYAWCTEPREPIQNDTMVKIVSALEALYEKSAALRQPYLLPVSKESTRQNRVVAGVLALAYFAVLALASRNATRALAVGSAALILYNALIVAAGHAVLGRYAEPTSVLYGVLAAIWVTMLLRQLAAIFKQLTPARRKDTIP